MVTNFWLLFVLRILAGAACGGSFPVGMAMISDLVPLSQRQVMIGRLLTATISGNLLGAAAAGIVADVMHWRGVFVILGVISLAALAARLFRPARPAGDAAAAARRRARCWRRNRSIFAIRTARICYVTVALEALFLFGLFPYVAVLLAASGEPRASIAGLVVAAFAVGGMVYSLSVRPLLRWFGQKQHHDRRRRAVGDRPVRRRGQCQPWPVQALAFAAMGCGFYMLHASIQVYVTEFAPATRSSAVAFHTFSFFIGAGVSPIVYGIGIERLGTVITLSIAASAWRSWASSARSFWCGRVRLSRGRDRARRLVGQPDALGQPAGLPEHVDRHAAARIPVAADPQPLRLEQAGEPLADADRAVLVERAVVAEARRDRASATSTPAASAPARSRSRDARSPAGR